MKLETRSRILTTRFLCYAPARFSHSKGCEPKAISRAGIEVVWPKTTGVPRNPIGQRNIEQSLHLPHDFGNSKCPATNKLNHSWPISACLASCMVPGSWLLEVAWMACGCGRSTVAAASLASLVFFLLRYPMHIVGASVWSIAIMILLLTLSCQCGGKTWKILKKSVRFSALLQNSLKH